MPRTEYPPTLTEVEQVELAHALGFHFDAHPECHKDREHQIVIATSVVNRMIRRRAGVIE